MEKFSSEKADSSFEGTAEIKLNLDVILPEEKKGMKQFLDSANEKVKWGAMAFLLVSATACNREQSFNASDFERKASASMSSEQEDKKDTFSGYGVSTETEDGKVVKTPYG